ncbi:MAG TPA: thiamine phosphate synthase [Terriglobales bacterium]|nr:thiamine phosphate synthase [Terriglobales bacterium]
MKLPALYPILDAEMAAARGHDLLACARGFASLGLAVQQLRAKTLPGGEFLRLAERLRAVVPCLIVNDRLDVALAARADGVHLGQDDLPAAAAQSLAPPHWVRGLSTHNLEQARLAAANHPGYLALGPIFSTTSKLKPDPVVGLQTLSALRQTYRGPLAAIGGIRLDNCESVWRAGADAVAVISALWTAEQPVEAARQFLLAFAQVSCHSTQKSPEKNPALRPGTPDPLA